MKIRPVAALLAGAVLLAVLLFTWLILCRPTEVRIAGTQAALPRASGESEFILPEALEAARTEAVRGGARALLVHRRGHRVFAYFAGTADGNRELQGGDLAAVVLALSLHEPGQAMLPDAEGAAGLVSERLWLPLRASDAWLSDDGAQQPLRCCIRARLDDWMRVGDLLLGLGAYLGERVVSADSVRQLLAAHDAPPALGDEPLLARDGVAFDLQSDVRLWLVPRRNLAVLVWADAEMARNTLLPNIILRGLNDQAPAIGGDIRDLVPGH